jgi:UDP-N-acetylmuramate--alanine ligase
MSSMRTGKSEALRRFHNIHFVGIGGSGMSGIAEVVANLGYSVSGSDLVASDATQSLSNLGVTIHIGHRGENIGDADVLVVSSAVSDDNPEVQAAKEHRIPVIPRAEMLAELMRFRQGIAVAGTHGKTTTTSLAASLLAAAGLDPTFVIGGLVNSFGSHARLGEGEYLLAEADESDGSFLLLQPVIAVITNIDRDHLDAYQNSFSNLRRAFLDFTHHLPFYGTAILCIDDPEVARLANEVSRSMVTYGLDSAADIRAEAVQQDGRLMSFDLHLPGSADPISVCLNLPGIHNVRNALGALAIAWELGVDIGSVVSALEDFQGIGRRFAEVGRVAITAGNVDIIEDYGHHPSELSATISAARSGWPDRRIVAVFQPHRYTRTYDQFEEFANVLSVADALVITDIYAAGEEPLEGISSTTLCQAIRARGKTIPVLIHDVMKLPSELPALLRDNDLVLLLGAGSIGQVAKRIRAHGLSLPGVRDAG